MPHREASQIVEVGIVETGDVHRQYTAALIGGSPGMRVAWSCATAKDAMELLASHYTRVVLISLFLADIPGTELIRRMRVQWPSALPILLIPESQSLRSLEALEAGASGYLPTPCDAGMLLRAISGVHAGESVLGNPVAAPVIEYFRARGSIINRLTERERQVLIALSDGLSLDEIVVKLGIGKETGYTHVRNVLGKLGARSIAQAVAFYLNPRAANLINSTNSSYTSAD